MDLNPQIVIDELVKKVNELQTQNIMMAALNRQLQGQVQMLSQSLGDLSKSEDVSEDSNI